MGKHILILGGGYMGSVIAEDLSIDTNHTITIVDKHIPIETREMNLKVIECDLDTKIITSLISQAHLVVNALPSAMSDYVWEAATTVNVPLVDVSYQESYKNWNEWDNHAKVANIPIVCDVGIAPGLTNLIVGKVLAEQGEIKTGRLFVGGVSEDTSYPYGYATTWSLEDLYKEYKRPATFINDRVKYTKPALSGVEEIYIPGAGLMEGFLTDGLRSLLRLKNINTLYEKTLRWTGHAKKVRPLLEDKEKFIAELHKCKDIKDLLVLYCEIDGREFKLIERSKCGMTAMQRCTALTCSTFTKLVADGLIEPGLWAPEHIAAKEGMYQFIVDELAKYDVILEEVTHN